jgi:hypothetical protein
VDGKTLRGARLDSGRQVHLLSALTFEEGVTIAQARVDSKTNEVTVFRPMLKGLDLPGVVVTADAMHTGRRRAPPLVGLPLRGELRPRLPATLRPRCRAEVQRDLLLRNRPAR